MGNDANLPPYSSHSCVWRLLSYLPTHFLFQNKRIIWLVLPYRNSLSATEKGPSGKVKHSNIWWSLTCPFDLTAPLMVQPKNFSSHKTSFVSVQKPTRLRSNKWTGRPSHKHTVHVVFSAVHLHKCFCFHDIFESWTDWFNSLLSLIWGFCPFKPVNTQAATARLIPQCNISQHVTNCFFKNSVNWFKRWKEFLKQGKDQRQFPTLEIILLGASLWMKGARGR